MNRKLALTVGLLAAVLATVTTTSSQATVPGKNGLILFERQVGKTLQLFTINPNGRGLRQITNERFVGGHAAWAPDGKSVVMEHGKGLGVLDVNSGKIRQLVTRTAIYPAFSPDGKWIVFAQSTIAHNEGLWMMGANGGQRRYVANGDGCHHAIFSPDATRLACLRKGALFVVNVDGSGRRPLVRQSLGVEGKIDWSPDGSRILFHDANFRLFTIAADGAGLTQLARGRNFCSESFSPDGSKILLLGNCESATGSYLRVMNVDGSGVTRMPNTKGAHWASWGRQPKPGTTRRNSTE